MPLLQHTRGGYQFLSGGPPFSSGVVALPGYQIVRVVLQTPLPYRHGLTQMARYLTAQGHPAAALCSIELRSPHQLSVEAFDSFNQAYRQLLAELDMLADEHTPIIRTNVVPAVRPPAETVLYACSYTVPYTEGQAQPPAFVIGGVAEVRARTIAPAHVVRYGETSTEALRDKAAYVTGVLTTRLERLGVSWNNATTTSVYTIHPLQPLLAATLLPHFGTASAYGIQWHYSRPPVTGLEFEMDIRGIWHQTRLDLGD